MEDFMQKALSVLKRIVIVIVVIGVGYLAFMYFGNYSNGERVGKVMKLSKKGVVFKTWEGQLGMESFGAVNSQNQLSQTFEFSVKGGDEEVLQKLQNAMNENRRVNIKYDEKYITVAWRGDTKHLITEVTVLEVDDDSNNRNPF